MHSWEHNSQWLRAVGHQDVSDLKQKSCTNSTDVTTSTNDSDTKPMLRLLINGTTEYVAPSDIWVNKLKTIIAPIATLWMACEKHNNATPSQRRAMQSQRTRPLRPHFRPRRSRKSLPGYGQKYSLIQITSHPAGADQIHPNGSAYMAAILLIVSSTPKQAAN